MKIRASGRLALAPAILILVSLFIVSCDEGGGEPVEQARPAPISFTNPLIDAKPGEWALYRQLNGSELYIEVKAVNPRTRVVTVQQRETAKGTGRLLASSEQQLSPNQFLFGLASSGAVVTRLSTEKIRVAGRDWDCLCVETLGPFQGPLKHYFSEDAPATGLVLQRKKDVATNADNETLIDWSGRKGTE